MMDRRIVGSGVLAGFFCGLIIYVFSLNAEIASLRNQLRINESSSRLANDQIGELTYQLLQKSNEDRFSDMREFVAGAVDALRRPEYYNEVWHAGYDRGASVEQYARTIEFKDKTYTKSQE